MKMSKICVFCGSQTIGTAFYEAQTSKFAELLVARKLELVYGGIDMGLMGTIALNVTKLGGRVTGIVPHNHFNANITNIESSHLIITKSMSERKDKMIELSDAFVVLPGGVGTLDELFEIWTNLQLGLHNKPIGILNLSGYYDHLIAFIENAIKIGFITDNRSQLIISQSPEELLNSFENMNNI